MSHPPLLAVVTQPESLGRAYRSPGVPASQRLPGDLTCELVITLPKSVMQALRQQAALAEFRPRVRSIRHKTVGRDNLFKTVLEESERA